MNGEYGVIPQLGTDRPWTGGTLSGRKKANLPACRKRRRLDKRGKGGERHCVRRAGYAAESKIHIEIKERINLSLGTQVDLQILKKSADCPTGKERQPKRES